MISHRHTVQVYCFVLTLNVFLAASLVSGACVSPWLQIDDACYYISTNNKSGQVESWHQSQSWCLQNGGHLATIDDMDDRKLITNITQLESYNGGVWIGLNKLEDRINYKWIDGSTSEFRDWALGEPNDANNGMCVYQLTHYLQDCFTHDPDVNTVRGLFDFPQNDFPPHTFYFDYLNGMTDEEGSAVCQAHCSAEPLCYSYTFISNSCPDITWRGECMGRSNEFDVSEQAVYAISGKRFTCNETEIWYSANCGETRGFICKKPVDATSTPIPTTPTTPVVPGFCPAGYIDGGGNKCFKIVNSSSEAGVTWDEALSLCRAEPGIAPDLASILSEYENAAITMHLRNEYWGFWIGLKRSNSFVHQWVWSDNQEVNYFNWAPEKPVGSAYCTELWTHPGPSGTWNNLECLQKRGYICQIYKDANSVVSTPPTTPAHTCQTDYYNYGGICYRKITTGSSWSAALATCEADGATLATIHNEAENSALYVFGNDIAPFWIGYNKNENDEWVWTDGWPRIYSNWNGGEEPGTGGGCASFKNNSKWKDDQCESSLAAICMISTATAPTAQTPVEGICPPDWVDYGSYCYYFSTFSWTWESAVEDCDSEAGIMKGSLASIHSADENAFIQAHLKQLGSEVAWIGLHKETLSSPHTWSDGSELQFTRWAPGEPSDKNGTQRCVAMELELWPGLWGDHRCDDYKDYVCKVPKVVASGECDAPWRHLNDACYYLSSTEDSAQVLSWHQSQDWCIANGGDLATIEDVNERKRISSVTQRELYNGTLWIGLNKLDDEINYVWSDGSTSEFRDWAKGEPNEENNGMCTFQLTHPPLHDEFTHDPGVNTIKGLFEYPFDDNPPFTFYFDWLYGMNDIDGAMECQRLCSEEKFCSSYTFISNSCPDVTWAGECMGRSDKFNVSEPAVFAISGKRLYYGTWYVANCGEMRGFMCKKAHRNVTTASQRKLKATSTVPGFCPAGYIDGGGTKCFKIVVSTDEDGVDWDTAVDRCRAEPGKAPNLASILSEYENAAITMHLRNEYWGFWIGLRRSTSLPDQWVWTDNQEVSYLNWAPEKPTNSEDCTELWTHPGPAGTWNNLNCGQKRGYICQVKKDENITTPPTTPVHSCKTAYYNYGGICYRKITAASSWSSALATCEADGATLATIHSEADNSALFVFGSDIAPFWIGYHKTENDEWVWTDGWPEIYSNWNGGEEPGTGGGCASFKNNSKWKDDQCNASLTAICMISTASVPTTPALLEGVCPSDWLEYGSNCYYFGIDNLTWQTAGEVCNSKADPLTVGSLASIHSAVENYFIYDRLKALSLEDAVWIGLYKEAYGMPNKWSDGSQLQYARWAPGEPNDKNGTQQNCVVVQVSTWPGMWNDQQCLDSKPYVCKAPKVNSSTTTPAISSVNPSTTTPTISPGTSCLCGWETHGTSCYHMDISQRLTFDQSQAACVQLGGSHAHLATIPDDDTNIFLAQMVTRQSSSWVQTWIGLRRTNSDAQFLWIDNTVLSFTNWAPGEPSNVVNEHCAYMHFENGEWADLNCDTSHLAYICEIKQEYLNQPTIIPQEPASSNSGVYLSSGELAGVILGTMFGTILLCLIVFVVYSSVRGESRSPASRPLGVTEPANANDVPYTTFQLSRSSSMKSNAYESDQFELSA